MQHYFASKKIDDIIYFKEEDYHHIKDVMRFKLKDNVVATVNNKQYLVELSSLKEIQGKIIEEYQNKELIKTNLIMSYIKNDKFEFIIQKATELNVTTFIPYFADHSIIKLDEKDIDKKMDRYEKIIKEASEQCERNSLMEIVRPINKDKIDLYKSSLNILIDEKEGRENPSNTLLKLLENKPYDSITVIIGPEGGFSQQEREYFHSLNFVSVSLSSSILRAETAAISTLSIINIVNEGK